MTVREEMLRETLETIARECGQLASIASANNDVFYLNELCELQRIATKSLKEEAA